ncbi:hypothetical protein GR212_33480 [Rhizobium lusitanum]|uniref:Uncharacterized protein n=1 Tax=Rhizobium lusitanum TaxID=293958 RepID=A0A6L9UFN5_9HYPH|nr:hypothetical protein [Rhizobium lusitanum]NEI74464.1 hypothetical protein [Rhizobium lusitanum]
MQRYHHLTEGIFRPDELAMLQAIFNEIIERPWFDLNEFSREAFATQVIQLYRSGSTDFDELKELSILTARAYFSRDDVEERQKAIECLRQVERRASLTED